MVLLLAMLCICSTGYSAPVPTDTDVERVLNREFKPVWDSNTTVIHHRDGLTVNDSFTAGVGDAGISIDTTNYNHVLVLAKVGGTTPSWDITPIYTYSTIRNGVKVSNQFRGTSKTVTGDTIYKAETMGCRNFAIRADNKSGTNPTISIDVVLLN